MKKRGREINIKINLTNRWLYTLIAIGILAIIGVGVYALTPGVKPNPGHLSSEMAPPSPCASGQFLKFDGTNWVCGSDYCPGGICRTDTYYGSTSSSKMLVGESGNNVYIRGTILIDSWKLYSIESCANWAITGCPQGANCDKMYNGKRILCYWDDTSIPNADRMYCGNNEHDICTVWDFVTEKPLQETLGDAAYRTEPRWPTSADFLLLCPSGSCGDVDVNSPSGNNHLP